MVDGHYVLSLLGCANLIELTLLLGSFIALCVTSTPSAQVMNVSSTSNVNSIFLYDIDVNTIKQVGQVLLLVLFLFTLISFLAHMTFAFRYRYSWHRLSTGIAFLCLIYASVLFGMSVAISCWEDKLRKRLSHTDGTDQLTNTSNDLSKPKIGSAAAAATFGFAACLLFLAEALIRFRRLADKIHI